VFWATAMPFVWMSSSFTHFSGKTLFLSGTRICHATDNDDSEVSAQDCNYFQLFWRLPWAFNNLNHTIEGHFWHSGGGRKEGKDRVTEKMLFLRWQYLSVGEKSHDITWDDHDLFAAHFGDVSDSLSWQSESGFQVSGWFVIGTIR